MSLCALTGSHMAFVCRDPSALQRALNDLQAPLRAVQTANQEDGQGNGKERPSLAPEPLLGALQSAHAQSALNAARAAGLIGVVTLEDVLEVLLSEEVGARTYSSLSLFFFFFHSQLCSQITSMSTPCLYG